MASAHPSVVGRELEIASFQRILSASADPHRAAGRARLVVISGEAGIGKSALLAALRSLAAARGFTVFAGQAREFERERPFHPLSEAFSAATDDRELRTQPLAELLGTAEDPAPGGPTARFRLLDSIVQHLHRASANAPTLLVLDDVQWADTSTFEALHAVLRRLAERPILIAVAHRPLPSRPELAAILDAFHGLCEHMAVRALDMTSSSTIAAALLGYPPGPALEETLARTAGNAFFVRELITALREDGLVEIREGHAEVGAVSLPPSLRATIVRRVGLLPETATTLLRWAAVLGPAFSIRDLSVVAGTSVSEILERLEPAIRSRVLVDADSRLAFQHDLVHEAVITDMPAAVRQGLHLEVARTLGASGASALDVAPHFSRGVSGRSLEGAEWLRRAAAEVAGRSPFAAIDLLSRAIEMTSSGDEIRAECRADLVRASLWAGKWQAAEELAREALESEREPSRAARLRFALARSLIYRARTDDSIAEAELALAASDGDGRARLLADLSLRKPLTGDLSGGEASAREALALARPEDRLTIRSAMSGLALVASLGGRHAAAVAQGRDAVPRSDDAVAEVVEFVQPHFFHALALTGADDLAEARSILMTLRTRTADLGLEWAVGLAGVLIANAAFLQGDWVAARMEAQRGIEIGERTGTRVWSLLGLAIVATTAARSGDFAAARVAIAAGDRHVAGAGLSQLGLERWLAARAAVQASLGDAEGALEAGLEGLAELRRRGFDGARRDLLLSVTLAAGRAGRDDVIAELATAVPGDRDDSRSGEAVAAIVLARAAGDAAGAEAAATLLRSTQRRALLGDALDIAAGVAFAAGGMPRGRELLLEALEVHRHAGAAVDVARIEQQLRAMGVRPGARGARRRTAETGWDSLTQAELDVAQLAAQGLTNRQIAERLFVSHRTVATHLSHVFAKVGLASRVELAAALSARRSPQA